MTHTRLFLAATLSLALTAAGVHAAGPQPQDEQSILLDTLRANRKAFVAVNLQLSEGEAKNKAALCKFVPAHHRGSPIAIRLSELRLGPCSGLAQLELVGFGSVLRSFQTVAA